jgi:threonine dehydratase
MKKLPTLAGIEDAHRFVRSYLQETPLVRSELLSRAFDADVWIKNEMVSPIASFKARGALVDIARAQRRQHINRVVASSSGNHGQGVAIAAKFLGLEADIFLPREANPGKVAMIKALGATIHIVEQYPQVKAEARGFAAEHSYHVVDDGGSLDLMEGAGTIGLEIARSLGAIDLMFVPVGDGALINGTACAVKALHPTTRVISVQAAGAPALTESYRARKILECSAATIADGLATWVPAKLAFDAMQEFVDDAVLVGDEELLAAIHTLAESAHLLVEPSAAAALAGAWAKRKDLVGRRVVLVLTGANVTMDVLRDALATPPLFRSTLWSDQ